MVVRKNELDSRSNGKLSDLTGHVELVFVTENRREVSRGGWCALVCKRSFIKFAFKN